VLGVGRYDLQETGGWFLFGALDDIRQTLLHGGSGHLTVNVENPSRTRRLPPQHLPDASDRVCDCKSEMSLSSSTPRIDHYAVAFADDRSEHELARGKLKVEQLFGVECLQAFSIVAGFFSFMVFVGFLVARVKRLRFLGGHPLGAHPSTSTSAFVNSSAPTSLPCPTSFASRRQGTIRLPPISTARTSSAFNSSPDKS